MLDSIAEVIINDYELENTSITSDILTTLCVLPCNTYYSEEQMLIRNDAELLNYFGKPNSTNYKFWWNAWNYLQYGSSLSVIRPIDSAWQNASLVFVSGDTPTIAKNMTANMSTTKKAENYLSEYTLSNKFEVFNRFVSTEDDTAVIICDDQNSFISSITNEKIDVVSKKDISLASDNYDQEMLIVKKDFTVINGIQLVSEGNCKVYFSVNELFPETVEAFEFDINLLGINKSFVATLITKSVPFSSDSLYSLDFEDIGDTVKTYFDNITDSNSFYLQVDATCIDIPTNQSSHNKDAIFYNTNNKKIYYYYNTWRVVDATDRSIYCKLDGKSYINGVGTKVAADTYYLNNEIRKSKPLESSPNQEDITAVIEPINMPFVVSTTSASPVIGYVKTLYGNLNHLVNSIIDGGIVKYTELTDSFAEVSVADGVSYFVENLGVAYKRVSGEWVLSTDEYYLNSKNFAVLKLYEPALYKTDKSIVTFKDLIQYTPDFTKEFVVLVLKKDSDI